MRGHTGRCKRYTASSTLPSTTAPTTTIRRSPTHRGARLHLLLPSMVHSLHTFIAFGPQPTCMLRIPIVHFHQAVRRMWTVDIHILIRLISKRLCTRVQPFGKRLSFFFLSVVWQREGGGAIVSRRHGRPKREESGDRGGRGGICVGRV